MKDQTEHMGKDWRTKAEIAGHYQIGVRTVTKLMRRKILPYGKLRNLVRFDVAACDRAMEFFGNSSRLEGVKRTAPDGRAARHWQTKRQLAGHIRFSERSITTLMRQQVLPFLKLGRIVRFDLAECDRVMESLTIRSVVERRLSSQPNVTDPSSRFLSSGT
jgi:hypothetical protein